MKKITIMRLPDKRKSAIDYFFDMAKSDIDVMIKSSIYISPMCVIAMVDDPYLHFTDNRWVGDEVTIGDVYYPPLSYELEEPCSKYGNYYKVKKITYNNYTYYPYLKGRVIIIAREAEEIPNFDE